MIQTPTAKKKIKAQFKTQFKTALDVSLDGLEMLGIEMSDECVIALAKVVYVAMTERGSTREQIWQQMSEGVGISLGGYSANIIKKDKE